MVCHAHLILELGYNGVSCTPNSQAKLQRQQLRLGTVNLQVHTTLTERVDNNVCYFNSVTSSRTVTMTTAHTQWLTATNMVTLFIHTQIGRYKTYFTLTGTYQFSSIQTWPLFISWSKLIVVSLVIPTSLTWSVPLLTCQTWLCSTYPTLLDQVCNLFHPARHVCTSSTLLDQACTSSTLLDQACTSSTLLDLSTRPVCTSSSTLLDQACTSSTLLDLSTRPVCTSSTLLDLPELHPLH